MDSSSPQWQHDRISIRLHIVEGILTAIDDRVAIIEALGTMADSQAAMRVLQAEPWKFSEMQAAHVLDLPFRRVTALGREQLASERIELIRQLDDQL